METQFVTQYRFLYEQENEILIAFLPDGTSVRHEGVKLGYLRGLEIASDKLEYYRVNIVPNCPLVLE